MKLGAVPKTTSYMMAIPVNNEDIKNPEQIYERIEASSEIKLVKKSFDDKNQCPMLTLSYKGKEYVVDVFVEKINIPPNFAFCHPVKPDDLKILRSAEVGVTTAFTYEDPFESYLFQVKLMNCILPNHVALVDYNTEKIMSAEWSKMTANSEISPGPSYLFSINTIKGKNEEIWLHTHGLNRCGFIELEILNSNIENHNTHAMMLNIIANKMLNENSFENETNPILVANLTSGAGIVATWLNWEDAVKKYDENIAGGANSRKTGHNLFNGVLFIYPTPEHFKDMKPVPLHEINNLNLDDVLISVSNKETERMSKLAQERMSYFLKAIVMDGVKGIVKVSLTIEDGKPETEYLWVEVDNLDGESISAKLIQKPFYTKRLEIGDSVKIMASDVTDWMLNINNNRIAPDNAFLVDSFVETTEKRL